MPIIDVQNLGKVYPVALKEPGFKGTLQHFFHRTYRNIEAVKQVSFSIEPGEIVGFLGPNGAGKTTTLKMLTGLIHPSTGSVRISNYEPFARRRQFLEQITLVMGQKQQLIWDLPALDSLRINAAVYGISLGDFRQRVGELAEMLSIQEQLKQPVRKLSLGERMKAEMLAALLHRPQVLFLDEPTLGLDVNAQTAVREFLQEYNQRYGATILLTSHYMADITALCDRVLVIHQGRLIYDGLLDGLLEQFAPYREVSIEFDSTQTITKEQLHHYGNLQNIEGCKATFLVPADDLTHTVSSLLNSLKIQDLSIAEPPIEDVIAKVFESGKT
ncbi:MAG: ATP-binding cassette domain-containing protein [Cyanobacteria bacterium P01_D01_bin.36]